MNLAGETVAAEFLSLAILILAAGMTIGSLLALLLRLVRHD
jgi:hypothetical protein